MRKLSGPIDASLITKEFFPGHVGHEDNINCGQCMEWAYIAYRLYEDVELYSNHCHAFVKQGGKYYDSESPNGSRSYRGLKCNQMCGMKYAEKQTLREFQTSWENAGVDWKGLDLYIKSFWRKLDKDNLSRNNKVRKAA